MTGIDIMIGVLWDILKQIGVALIFAQAPSASNLKPWIAWGHPIIPLSSIFSSDVISGSSGSPGF
jgi:hypothetical protein